MRRNSVSSICFLGTAGLLGAILLAVGGPPAVGSMSQGGPQFGAPGAPPAAGPPAGMGAGGLPGGAAMPLSSRMSEEMMRAAASAPAPPSPVTREKTTVTVAMVAKYGDEEDADLRRYEATFGARYVVKNKKNEKTTVQVFFPYPSSADTLPDASVWVDGKEPSDVVYSQRGVSWEVTRLVYLHCAAQSSPVRVSGALGARHRRDGNSGLRSVPLTVRVKFSSLMRSPWSSM